MSEVVVIGGGIVGSSVAYNAVRAGMRVTVVDREDEGQATAAGAGIMAPGVGYREDAAHNALVAASAGYYPKLLAQLAEDGETETGYDRVGAIRIAQNEAEVAALEIAKAFAEETRDAGVPGIDEVSMLRGDEAKSLWPPLANVPAALHIAGTARIDGRLMRQALQRAAERRGATIVRGEARLQRESSGAVQVSVDGVHVPADSIVIAAGAWSAPLGQALGVTLPIAPQRGQIAHLTMPQTDTSHWPVLLTMQSHYLLTFRPNRVVVGATRENHTGFDYRLTAGGVHQVLNEALGVAPGLAAATLREIRIGFRPVTPDGLPLLGRVPGLPNVYVATGHGPTGLTMGPQSGAMIVALLRGEPIDLDLRPYAMERFATSPSA